MHPPTIIYAMLIGLALAAALLAGYQSAGEKGYDWVHKVGFAAIVALTVYVILDIEYPRLGFVRIDAIDQLLVDARRHERLGARMRPGGAWSASLWARSRHRGSPPHRGERTHRVPRAR